eukprot:1160600-Pelagomonas_calceolata.AAC.2
MGLWVQQVLGTRMGAREVQDSTVYALQQEHVHAGKHVSKSQSMHWIGQDATVHALQQEHDATVHALQQEPVRAAPEEQKHSALTKLVLAREDAHGISFAIIFTACTAYKVHRKRAMRASARLQQPVQHITPPALD